MPALPARIARHCPLTGAGSTRMAALRSHSPTAQSPQDRIEHSVELLADVLREEPQDEVAVLLKQLVLAAVAPIGDRIRQVLSAIQFHGDARLGAQEVDFQRAKPVERDR